MRGSHTANGAKLGAKVVRLWSAAVVGLAVKRRAASFLGDVRRRLRCLFEKYLVQV